MGGEARSSGSREGRKGAALLVTVFLSQCVRNRMRRTLPTLLENTPLLAPQTVYLVLTSLSQRKKEPRDCLA